MCGQVEVALPGEVEQPARRAGHDVDAGLEGGDLRLVRTAAVDGEHPRAQALTRDDEVGGDLNREFAGRDDDQRARAMIVDEVNELKQWRPERQRLAGAGAGLPDQVGAGERQRDRQRLNGERDGDADGLEGPGGLGSNPEFGKRGQWKASQRG